MTNATYQLRVLFDAGAGTCLWSLNDAARAKFGYAIEPRALPIPTPLVEELEAVIRSYDASIDWNDPGAESPWSPARFSEFHGGARSVIERLRAALGNDYTVTDVQVAPEPATER